jgi:hypothetical protein
MFYTIRQKLLYAQSENLGIFDNFMTQLELIVSKIEEGFTHILFNQNKEVKVGDTTIIVNFATLAENSNDPLLDLTNQYFEASYSFISWLNDFNETPYANQYAFYWYKYDGETPASAFMPFGWQMLNVNRTEDGTLESVITNLQEILISLDSTKQTQKYKALVFFNHQKYESNELEFTNLETKPNIENSKEANTIRIIHGENSQDAYPFYLSSGYLINGAEAGKQRILKVQYLNENGIVDMDALQGA